MRWMVVALVATWASGAWATNLVYTVPSDGQLRTFNADGDSVVECSGGPLTAAVTTAHLYGVRYGDPAARFSKLGDPETEIGSHSVVGKEGAADSFPAPWSGWFMVRMENGRGLSCKGVVAYVAPGTTTGVPVEAEADPVVIVRLFDVSGRMVGVMRGRFWYRVARARGRIEADALRDGVIREHLPSGIYFLRGVRVSGASGEDEKRKAILVR